jgi:hypothetical protein
VAFQERGDRVAAGRVDVPSEDIEGVTLGC